MIIWLHPRDAGRFKIPKTISIIYHVNALHDRNHIIISLDVTKAFNKTQHLPFMIQVMKNLGIWGTYLNIIKAIYNMTKGNIIVNGKNQSIPTSKRDETRIATLSIPAQYCALSLV